MRSWHRWLASSMAAALAFALATLGGDGSLAIGDPIYVDAQATGDCNGTSWEHAYTDLQLALDAAESGDDVWVAEGIYRPTAAHGGIEERYKSFELKNGVALYGGFAGSEEYLAERDWIAHETILSGDIGIEDDASDNSYHVLYHPASLLLDDSALLDGFTITGGNADGNPPHQQGGGIYNDRSSPALSNCTFTGNSAATGGGMYNDDCSPTLTNCTFETNSATYGGGMGNYFSSPSLTSCTFKGNTADYGGAIDNFYSSSPGLTGCVLKGNAANYDGGGMHNEYNSAPSLTSCIFADNSANRYGGGMHNKGSSPELTNCTFSGNSASSEGGGIYNDDSSPVLTGCAFVDNSAGYGGGMQNTYSTAPALTNCTFEGNSAIYGGGGMHNYSSSPLLANCTFADNSTEGVGGGMRNYSSSPTLTNCTFAGNSADARGGGIYNRSSSPTLTNCTLNGNTSEASGGGIFNWSSSPTLTNCILWGDAPDEVYNDDEASTPVVTYSNIQGSYAGEGNIDANPWFVGAVKGDFHLGACSPCIDAGDDSAPSLPNLDFEGNDRILDGDGNGTATVDMGVDEVAVPKICFRACLPMVLKGY